MGVPTMLVTLFGHLDIEIQIRSYTHASYSRVLTADAVKRRLLSIGGRGTHVDYL